MNTQEINKALKGMYAKPPPRFEIDEEKETMLMRCWLCPKEVEFKFGGFPDGWKIIKMRTPGEIDISLPLCMDCFPMAEALYKGMKEKGMI